MVTLEQLNALLKEAKAASNYLHYPEFLDSEKIQGGARLTASLLYRAIVDAENNLRANDYVWFNDRWVKRGDI